MFFIHILMIVAGLLLLGVGFGAAHYRTGALQKLGATLAPIGLLIALMGVLLLCVPDFF